MFEICNPKECTGCAACANICAYDAITIEPNKYGFLHPVINQDTCVDCGSCKKICPNNTLPNYEYPFEAYAGCASDPIEQLSSTSGGVATVLSKKIIEEGGIVYGCNGTDIHNVHHTRVEQENGINDLKGSKYVQSRIGSIIRDIKRDLIDGHSVMFIGTPCQVAGVLSCVPKKLHDKLITVDFVCHGVPSQQILNDALQCIGFNTESGISSVSFRVKELKHSLFTNKRTIAYQGNLNMCPHDGAYYTRYGMFNKYIFSPFPKNDYIVGFLSGVFYRESCYGCHYARPERVSDITLGDYHFEKKEYCKIAGGNRLLSKIIVNTSKGTEILRLVSDNINLQPIIYASLLKKHGQLSRPMKKHPLRTQFFQKYIALGYDNAIILLKEEKEKISKQMLISNIRDFIYAIPGCKSLIKLIREQ